MFHGLKVVVVAPCHNEAARIGSVVRRVKAAGVADAIWVVDDGSTDLSAAIAEAEGAVVFSTERRFGVGAAIHRGLMAAKDAFDVAVIIAGNDKDEPGEIHRLLEPIAAGRADLVQGSRYIKGGRVGGAMPLYRRLATRLHPWLFSLATGKSVTESTNGFRAVRCRILQDARLAICGPGLNGYEWEPYFYGRVIRLGYATAEVPVTKIYPRGGESYTKMRPWKDWWAMLRPLWRIYFSSP